MATKTQTFSVSAKDYESFGQLVMDALSDCNNFSTSFDGKSGKCDEISAPMVGMGANSWRRGRAYSVLEFDPKSQMVSITTTINGLMGALYNPKYADEICSSLASRIKRQDTKSKAAPVVSPVQQFSAADEIIKLKKLLDEGIITQEEFDKKKKELFGI